MLATTVKYEGLTWGQASVSSPEWHIVKGHDWKGAESVALRYTQNSSLCGTRLAVLKAGYPQTEATQVCSACVNKQAQIDLYVLSDLEFEVGLVRLGDMFADMVFQRKLISGHVREIGESFSVSRFNDHPIILADRSDCEGGYGPNGERYAILDAQHKTRAALYHNVRKETEVRAHIYHKLTIEKQSKKFSEANTDVKRQHPLHLYKVALKAREKWALEIKDAANTYGFEIGRNKLAAITFLQKCLKRGVLRVVLRIVSSVWSDYGEINYAACSEAVLKPIALLFRHPDVIEFNHEQEKIFVDRLIKQLRAVRGTQATPKNIEEVGHAPGVGDTATCNSTNLLIKIYNKRLRSGQLALLVREKAKNKS